MKENNFLKLKSIGKSVLHIFNPIRQNALTTDEQIKLISLFLGGFFVFMIYKESAMFKVIVSDSISDWDFITILYFLPILVLPVSTLFFWFKKRGGWILVTLFFSYSAIESVLLFFLELCRKPTGLHVLDAIFPTVQPAIYIGRFLIFSGFALVLCKNDIRSVYKIDKRTMYIVTVAGACLMLFISLT